MNDENQESLSAGLYIIATPIGNLGDITLRALETLKTVDLILCEDMRVTRKLLSAYNIKTPLNVYNDHTDEHAREKMINLMARGKSVGLVSDAGMPLISDPGYKLVKACGEENIPITSLPGANAPLTALQLSGLPSDRFLFLGFLPTKAGARKNALKEWEHCPATLIFYEAKQRVIKTLEDCLIVFGNRDVCIARELTKKFEEVITLPIEEALDALKARELKGEFVILIAPGEDNIPDKGALEKDIHSLLEEGESMKSISDILSDKYKMPKKEIYNLALSLKD